MLFLLGYVFQRVGTSTEVMTKTIFCNWELRLDLFMAHDDGWAKYKQRSKHSASLICSICTYWSPHEEEILARNSFSLQFMYFLLPLSLGMKCIQRFSFSTSELVVTVYSIKCRCSMCKNNVSYMETVCRAKTNVHSSGHDKFMLLVSSPPVISRAWMQHSSKNKMVCIFCKVI